MPIAPLIIRSLVLALVEDALKVLIPLGLGLLVLVIMTSQAIVVASYTSPTRRAELFRPLIVTASLRSGELGIADESGQIVVHGAVPAHLVLAIAEVWSGFDPTHACQSASPDARRGLVAVRPSEYSRWRIPLERALGRPALPVERGVCEPEHNVLIGIARLARFYLARQSEFLVENEAYRAALAEYDRQRQAWEACRALLPSDPSAPPTETPTCRAPDEALRQPPPACIERHGWPNPRSPERPEHRADWEDAETVCRVLDHYHDGLSFPRVWAARGIWQAALRQPIQTTPAAPRWDEPVEAPGGSAGYALSEAVRYARSQIGKPYIWGGGGLPVAPPVTGGPPPPPAAIHQSLSAAAARTGVPGCLLRSIAFIESGYNPRAVGPLIPRFAGTEDAHALGLMQFLPSTYRGYRARVDAITGKGLGMAGVWDAESAALAAGFYLRDSGAPADLRRAVYAYNHDWGYVERVLAGMQACQRGGGGGVAPAPAGFDCSGLVQWAYGMAGIRLPRTAEEQYRATVRVRYDQLRPGDLVFFCCDPSQPYTSVSHVGIYLGAGQMIDAPAPGLLVREGPVPLRGFIGGGRLHLSG